MKVRSALKPVVPMVALALAFAGPLFAQSASESFHKAGEDTENAGSSVGHAAVNVYHGTATATEDTAITAKVKTALHENDITEGADIHVTTVAGVVTLRGRVASERVSGEARHVAETTGGVKGVRNRLRVRSAS
ncbi:MAG TPA: BON domain-containing protein [Candidatus Binataceae bacterium]|nr:BON domain-containing protein [Candidatus Binataceae bacterium]